MPGAGGALDLPMREHRVAKTTARAPYNSGCAHLACEDCCPNRRQRFECRRASGIGEARNEFRGDPIIRVENDERFASSGNWEFADRFQFCRRTKARDHGDKRDAGAGWWKATDKFRCFTARSSDGRATNGSTAGDG
ncbi:MAG: hypothetical protein JWR26_958 [Pedosphaera sp.]|nr:hypothetical protein [Pedosphaera sp.]